MAERDQSKRPGAAGGFDEFEDRLSAVAPSTPHLDRAALMFRAGQETLRADLRRGQGRERGWQVAAAMALVAIVVTWSLSDESPTTVKRHRDAPAPASVNGVPGLVTIAGPSRDGHQDHYLRQRLVALTSGLDGLDAPAEPGRVDPFDNRRYRDLKEQHLTFPAESAGKAMLPRDVRER